ncbi:MAG: DNA-binding response regulator [Nitrospirae bacterium RBG_19FT_COMBO_58_9]|nr:MAG: DNA-binding response regulator [Nitrospirae bacterium RBG_19FT_COMBO_58_9]
MIGTALVKILIVDDHEVVRRGVKQILEETFPQVEVGEADTGQKGIAAVRQEPWDLAIVDISLPDQSGLELLVELRSTAPQLPLMVLSLHPEEQYAVRAFRAGAMAYLTKQTAPEELARAVKQVLSGRRYVTASLGECMAGNLSKNPTGLAHQTLSEREFEVLVLLAQGQSVKHIAQSLALSMKTVSTYRARLLDKLQLANTAELIRYALDHHLVE